MVEALTYASLASPGPAIRSYIDVVSGARVCGATEGRSALSPIGLQLSAPQEHLAEMRIFLEPLFSTTMHIDLDSTLENNALF